jgi:hypothetical protein
MSWLCLYITIGVCVGLITACFGEDLLSALALFATNIIVWPLTLAVVVMGVCIEAYQWNQSRITYRQVRKLIDNEHSRDKEDRIHRLQRVADLAESIMEDLEDEDQE